MGKKWNWKIISEHKSLTEGPLWIGNGLIYNECYESKTFFWDPKTMKSYLWRDKTGGANGMAFSRSGEIFVCEGENHRVVKINKDNPNNAPIILTNNQNVSSLNMPNDLAIDSLNRIYFSDPNYSANPNTRDNESVYMIESNFGGFNQVTQVTYDTKRPNGVLLSIDQKTLFIAESPIKKSTPRQLRGYPINSDGTLSDYYILHDFGPHRGIDGMTLTDKGNILATVGSKSSGPGPMIYEFNENGRVISSHPCPSDEPTNCSFGGDNNDLLFVTFATGKVYIIDNTNLKGNLTYPL